MDSFRDKVINYIIRVPKGKVVSYGQVAAACGSPRASRQVGGIFKALGPDQAGLPWWRVVNNLGFISIKGNWTATKELQRALLLKDGVAVSEGFIVDMQKYRLKR